MRKVLVAVTLAASVGLLLGASAPASAGTLDQQQNSSDSNAGLFSTQSIAQTFTPGMSGIVDQTDVVLSRFGTPPVSVTLQIRNASGGQPGNTVLASGSLNTSGIGATKSFVPFTFAAPALVTAGTQYTVVVYSPGAVGNAIGAWYQGANVYSGGSLYYGGGGIPPMGSWISQPTSDLAFKTYVAPAPPPAASATGQRAAALKKCKKKRSARARRKCKRKAKLLPV